jgi:DNA-directed RNA polymerase subunit RPC12/RpoP
MGFLKALTDATKSLKDNAKGLNGIRGYTFSPLIKSFICPHCLKSILMDKITSTTCPHCDTTTENLVGFFLVCPSCHSKIKYFDCPHCGNKIDLDAPYNHKELEEKRNV